MAAPTAPKALKRSIRESTLRRISGAGARNVGFGIYDEPRVCEAKSGPMWASAPTGALTESERKNQNPSVKTAGD